MLVDMRARPDFAATDDAELYDEYYKSMEEVRNWVKTNMSDPNVLKAQLSR
jgi:hypothetical protein